MLSKAMQAQAEATRRGRRGEGVEVARRQAKSGRHRMVVRRLTAAQGDIRAAQKAAALTRVAIAGRDAPRAVAGRQVLKDRLRSALGSIDAALLADGLEPGSHSPAKVAGKVRPTPPAPTPKAAASSASTLSGGGLNDPLTVSFVRTPEARAARDAADARRAREVARQEEEQRRREVARDREGHRGWIMD